MGQTLIEKVIGRKVGKDVKPGDIVTVPVDWCMVDDIMAPFAISKFEEMGFKKVWDPVYSLQSALVVYPLQLRFL